MFAIAAVDQNWAIGKDGDQFVYLPQDLKRFKALTTGHPVILGRKTLATFPGGRPLPGRRNMVLSRDLGFHLAGGEVFRDLNLLVRAAPEDAFVIGGASVYRALLPHCHTAYITRIQGRWPADVWFPNLDQDPAWRVAETQPPLEHEGLCFQYVTYTKA